MRLRTAGSGFETNRGLNVSLETGAVLARQHLLIEAQQDPVRAARLLEARLQTQSEPDGAMALAELSYYIGVNSQTAGARRRDAVVPRCGRSRRAGARRPGHVTARSGRRNSQPCGRAADPARPDQTRSRRR